MGGSTRELLQIHAYLRPLQQRLFSLLESCKTTRELKQIHAQIIVSDFTQKNYITSKLTSFCVESGDIQYANKAFKMIANPTTFIWNQMIKGYSRSENPQNSLHFYNQMMKEEAEPDGFTYSFLLTACVKQSFFKEGEQLHGRIVHNGMGSNVYVQTNLVNMYAASGESSGVLKAREVFDEMTQTNVVTCNSMLVGYFRAGLVDDARRFFDDILERSVVSWTTMIAGCAKNGKCKEALSLFYEMQRGGVELDRVTMLVALSACAELGDLETGRWIHSLVDKDLQFENRLQLVSLNNVLIHMYASCGHIEEAFVVFKAMKSRSVVSWTTMITGFAKHGYGKEALDVFRWMQNGDSGVRPDEITFLGVLSACNHTGMIDEGRYYFEYMTQSCKITPNIEHYGCMVDLLSRAGLLDEAYEIINTMPIKPNDVLWGGLLNGCRSYKNVELAGEAARQLMLELEPDRAVGYLVLLSNVYAAARKWPEVVNVRQRMLDIGVKKPPGRSWIQIDGVIHDFIAGDWTHKHTPAVYEMVGEVTRQAKLEDDMLESLVGM